MHVHLQRQSYYTICTQAIFALFGQEGLLQVIQPCIREYYSQGVGSIGGFTNTGRPCGQYDRSVGVAEVYAGVRGYPGM